MYLCDCCGEHVKSLDDYCELSHDGFHHGELIEDDDESAEDDDDESPFLED